MVMIVKLGHVESTNTDEYGQLKIKARIHEDGGEEDIPWAFPLLPKQFQVVPKVGEGVFIFTENTNKRHCNRYYIGPIISQPQYNTKCNFDYGRGPAMSGLEGHVIDPLPNINQDASTNGSFPNIGDVAMVGRDSQDIIMKNSDGGGDEVQIRCGIRKEKESQNSKLSALDNLSTVGKVIFNNVDPAYIQMKYKSNLGVSIKNYDAYENDYISEKSQTNSVVNVVADKINLVGVGDESVDVSRTNNDSMIHDGDMDKLMSNLHQLPYGDNLANYLKLLRDAILYHVHPYNGMKPVQGDYISRVQFFDINSILSKYVRIS